MSEEQSKWNYYALVGMVLGIIATFLIDTPLTPILPLVALIISLAGIAEARKTGVGLAYAIVGLILGVFVLVYYFYPI